MKGTRIIDESVNNTVFLPMSLQMAVQVITGIGAHISCKSAASPARPFSSAALTYFLGGPFFHSPTFLQVGIQALVPLRTADKPQLRCGLLVDTTKIRGTKRYVHHSDRASELPEP